MPTGPRPAPPAGVARVALIGWIFNHQTVNVFYLEVTHSAAVTVDDLKTIADGIHTSWVSDMKGGISTDAGLNQVDITFFPSTGTEIRYTGVYGEAGASSAAVEDASASYCMDWVISDYYRGGHPRSYFAGVDQSVVTNGSDISATFRTSFTASVNAFRNAINALTATNITAVVMGTVRFQSGGAWLSPPRFVAFTSAKFGNSGKLASQRRRIKS